MYQGPPPRHATVMPRSGVLRRWLFGRGAPATASAAAPVDFPPGDPAPAADDEAELALVRLADEAAAALAAVSRLVVRSGAEAQAYGDALEAHAGAIAAGPGGSPVAALAELTRAMIDRTRIAEQRMAAMGAEMQALQDSLAEARDDAGRDALTGLPNRRALQQRLALLAEAARATGAALSVAFCDIDRFKAINDTHGHDVGDRVLRLTADALGEAAGADCFVGRHGGEEFLMLFEGIDAATASARVDAVRGALSARHLRVRGTEAAVGHVTFSAGVAHLRADEADEALIARADAALYRAKQDGRDRVLRDD